MKKLLFIIILLVAGIANAQTTTSISQYGITWNFQDSESYGQFANGDYWVVHPVTITSITPTQTSTRNGTVVNPDAPNPQAYDSRANNFSTGDQISLPHTSSASQIQSIVSSDSTERTSSPYLDNVAVLTILLSTPPDDGDNLFRPGYCGTDKTYYYTTDLQTGELLTLSTTEQGDAFATLESRFERPQIELGEGSTNRRLRASNNMYNNYAPSNAGQLDRAIAKLSGDWTVNEKTDLLIYVVQAGIDRYNAALSGQTWPGGGGHQPGHKLNIVFAGFMLDETDIMDEGLETYFWENRLIQNALWGAETSEEDYWENVTLDRSQMYDMGDPYGYVDGGTTMTEVDVDNYQRITSMNCKGAVCWLRYYPDMQDHWSDVSDFIDYGERWVDHGLQALPDPCAPVPANEIGRSSSNWLAYGDTWGSNGSGGCITGSGGRFANGTPTSAQRDGDYADTGQYSNALTNEMWDDYSPGADVTPPTVHDTPVISADGETVTITFSETVVTTGYDNGDFDLDCSEAGSGISLDSIDGSGSIRTFEAATQINSGDTCNLDYTGEAGEIVDTADPANDLAAFSNATVTNSSTQTAPTVSGNAVIDTDGETVTITFTETVVDTYNDSFNLDCTTAGNDILLETITGSGSSRSFTADTVINSGDNCNLDYTGGADEIEDSEGYDLETFSDDDVTNNSTQEEPVAPPNNLGVSIN